MIPKERGIASRGEAMTNAVFASDGPRQARQCLPWCGVATTKAATSAATVAATSHDLGSPRKPGSPMARGKPNTAIAGRYGSYDRQDTRWPAGR